MIKGFFSAIEHLHNDAKSQFTFFPDNEEEQNAFAKFQSIISPISQYRGSTISTVLGTWN